MLKFSVRAALGFTFIALGAFSLKTYSQAASSSDPNLRRPVQITGFQPPQAQQRNPSTPQNLTPTQPLPRAPVGSGVQSPIVPAAPLVVPERMIRNLPHNQPIGTTRTEAGVCPPGGCPQPGVVWGTVNYIRDALTIDNIRHAFGSGRKCPAGDSRPGRSECTSRGYLYPVPANFAVGSEFGENRTTRIRGRSVSYQHEGLDIPAPQGTPIFAVMEGEVVARNCEQVEGRSYGNCLMILHPNGRMSLYAHLANSNRSCPQFNEIKNQIRSGQRVYVSQGDQIGCVGSTGRSSGPHLHFEFRPEGVFPSTGSGDRVFDPNDECGYHETRRRRR